LDTGEWVESSRREVGYPGQTITMTLSKGMRIILVEGDEPYKYKIEEVK